MSVTLELSKEFYKWLTKNDLDDPYVYMKRDLGREERKDGYFKVENMMNTFGMGLGVYQFQNLSVN